MFLKIDDSTKAARPDGFAAHGNAAGVVLEEMYRDLSTVDAFGVEENVDNFVL
ncbi:Hypothetical protein, putative [Bodo saltans]|uniref:Uncharacterized protein n=1 Tax=Bodo saltans TaxID=75058 RepID=A0A0S4IVV2_BODSA|nr:Hypothetical protein, putative [Bodo saltans]|eukprot:CUF93733.1 Hypothetical protein, putative [Bodo saltans]